MAQRHDNQYYPAYHWLRACRTQTTSYPKFADNQPIPTPLASNSWQIGQMLRQTEIDLEKETAHASLTLRRNPSGGYQVQQLMLGFYEFAIHGPAQC